MRSGKIGSVVCAVWLLSLALAGAVAAQSGETPWLGVSTQDITSELREGLNYRGQGVIVNRVVPQSPADRAGVRKGDVIATFNSRVVDSPSELVDLVRSARVGQSVSVGIVRDGARRTLNARLAEWPADMEDDVEQEFPDPPAAPRAPRAPRAPSTPRTFSFDWNGHDFEMPDGRGFMMMGMRGRLGVQVQDINSGLGEVLGIPSGKGVLVTDVMDDTPAERAGLKAGDVITRVGNEAVDDVDDLQKTLRDAEGRVSVTVSRRGVQRTVQAEIGEKRSGSGVFRMSPGDRRVVRIPDVRRRVQRDLGDDAGRSELDQEMKELREELRELRRMLEEMDRK